MIDQAQSRGDVPVTANPKTGLHSNRDLTDYDGASKSEESNGEMTRMRGRMRGECERGGGEGRGRWKRGG